MSATLPVSFIHPPKFDLDTLNDLTPDMATNKRSFRNTYLRKPEDRNQGTTGNVLSWLNAIADDDRVEVMLTNMSLILSEPSRKKDGVSIVIQGYRIYQVHTRLDATILSGIWSPEANCFIGNPPWETILQGMQAPTGLTTMRNDGLNSMSLSHPRYYSTSKSPIYRDDFLRLVASEAFSGDYSFIRHGLRRWLDTPDQLSHSLVTNALLNVKDPVAAMIRAIRHLPPDRYNHYIKEPSQKHGFTDCLLGKALRRMDDFSTD